MFIDFDEIKKQNISNELLLDLMEKLYIEFNSNFPQNIMINEFIDDASIDTATNSFSIDLSDYPISRNDILIVSEDGDIVITPTNIVSLNKNKVTFKHKKLRKKVNFFVTYKY